MCLERYRDGTRERQRTGDTGDDRGALGRRRANIHRRSCNISA